MRYVSRLSPGAWRLLTLAIVLNLLTGCKLSLIGPPSAETDDTATASSVTPPLAQVAPQAFGDTLVVNRNAAATPVTVLINDTDLNDDVLNVATVTQGAYGTVNIAPDSLSVNYTPDPGYSGTDTFDYTVSDGRGGADTGTVTVKVMTPFTWTGGAGTTDWMAPGNWHIGAPPTTPLHTAVFDATCTSNCSPTLTANVGILGIELGTGYGGVITQGAFQINIARWTQRSGTFVGGTDHFDVQGIFRMYGGTFTPPTGASFSVSHYGGVSLTFFDWSGGTINAAGAWLELGGSINGCGTGTLSIDTHGQTLEVQDLSISSAACGAGIHTSFRLVPGTVINVGRDFLDDIGEGERLIDGEIHVRRNVVKTLSGGTTNREACGTTRLILDGTGAQTISSTTQYSCLHALEINKPSGAVTPAPPTTAWGARTFRLVQGSFTMPSASFRIFDDTAGSSTSFFIAAGQAPNFIAATGTLDFTTTASSVGADVRIIDLSNQPLNFSGASLNFDMAGSAAGDVFQIAGSGNMTVNDLSVEQGRIDGTFFVNGDLHFHPAAQGGTASIRMSGIGNHTLTQDGTFPTGDFEVEKTGGGRVALTTNVTLGGAGQDLTLINGHLDLSGFNLTVTNQVIHTAGNLVIAGNETLTFTGGYVPSSNAWIHQTGPATGLPAAIASACPSYRIFGALTLNAPVSCRTVLVNTGGSLNAAGHQITVADTFAADSNFTGAGNQVVLGGAGPHVLSGTISFYDLTRTTSLAASLFFADGSSVTVTNALDLRGAAGQLLTIRTYSNGVTSTIDPQGGRTLQFLSVRDSVCLGATCAAGVTSTDATGNTNWSF